jgi:hypothetical protein
MNLLPEAFAQCKIVCGANCISQTPCLELRIHKKIRSVMLTDVVSGTLPSCLRPQPDLQPIIEGPIRSRRPFPKPPTWKAPAKSLKARDSNLSGPPR